jgi:hypothetical protein
VRDGKYIIAPSLIVAAMVCITVCRSVADRWRHGRTLVVTASVLVIMLTLISRQPVFNSVPILGDDVARYLWPTWTKTVKDSPVTDQENMDQVLGWIRNNTTTDAKFVGPRQIRAGALRPVIHDFAGAGMLIEGNPQAFIEAARRERMLRQPEYQDPMRRVVLMASWGADYWVTRVYEPGLRLAYTDQKYFIYDLRGNKEQTAQTASAAAVLNP